MARHHARIMVPIALYILGCSAPMTPVVPASLPRELHAASAAPSSLEPSVALAPLDSPPPLAAASPPADRAEWLAFGDSITADAFADPGVWLQAFVGAPAVIDAGVRGNTTFDALERVDDLLSTHPRARYVGVAFGTNDVAEAIEVPVYADHVRTLVRRVTLAGKTAMVARIPYSPDTRLARVPEYNHALDNLVRELGLSPGPDLFTAIQQNPEWLGPDHVHMNAAGNRGIQLGWAAAAVRMGLR